MGMWLPDEEFWERQPCPRPWPWVRRTHEFDRSWEDAIRLGLRPRCIFCDRTARWLTIHRRVYPQGG